MDNNGWISIFNKIAELVMRLAYINLLWILFTLTGLVVFGVFPATVGMFTIIRKWIRGDKEVPVFQCFWKTYRTDFLDANLLGFTFLLVGWALYVDLKLVQSLDGILFSILTYSIFVLIFVIILTFIYLFPVYVHFDLKRFQYLKQSFIIMILQPISTMMMIFGVLVVCFVMIFVQQRLILFFGASSLAYIVMMIANRGFNRLGKYAKNES